jgi:hypothetical protein
MCVAQNERMSEFVGARASRLEVVAWSQRGINQVVTKTLLFKSSSSFSILLLLFSLLSLVP